MVVSAIVGTAPANARDEAIARGIYVQNLYPIPTENPFWTGLAVVNPDQPGLSRHSNGPALVIASAVAIGIIAVISSFRFFSRARSRTSRLGWDDFFIFWAALAGITWLSLQIAMCTAGSLGKHAWNGTYNEYFWLQILIHYNQLVFCTWSCLSKVAIACFNWRLTGRSSITWRWVHITTLALSISYGIIFFLLTLLQCRPVPAAFNLIRASHELNYRCHIGRVPYASALLSLHTILDFILLGIPIVIVWRLQLARKQKLAAIIPLSFGAIGCVATILRFYFQWHVNESDILYEYIYQGMWSIVDTVIATCVTSLPACYVLLHRRFRQFTGARSSEGMNGHSSSNNNNNNENYHNSNDRASRPSRNAWGESNASASTQVTLTELDFGRPKSQASSHTVGGLDAEGREHVILEKPGAAVSDPELGEVTTPPQQEERGGSAGIFSGYGAVPAHPNIRDSYERRISVGR